MNIIHYVGYSARHPHPFLFEVPTGYSCYLLILTTTQSIIYSDGSYKEYGPNQAVLFAPSQPIHYGSCSDTYGNHWLRFSSDETFVTEFPQAGKPFSISDPEYYLNLFRLITWESNHSETSENLSPLLSVLFGKLHEEICPQQTTPHDTELLSLRRQILNHPQKNWTISMMSKELGLSSGYLQLLYKNKFGISCMDDVIKARIRLARDLLEYTESSVQTVAEQCGYNNVEHFSRQFLLHVGHSPLKYRRLHKATEHRTTGNPDHFRSD